MSFPGTFITAITKVASAVISLIYDFLWSDRTTDADYDINDTSDSNTPNTVNAKGIIFSRDGNTMVVSTDWNADIGAVQGTGSGRGIILFEFINDSWQPQAYMTPYPSSNVGSTWWGEALAISGDGNTIVIGDHANTNDGNVLVFEKGNGWSDGDTNYVATLQITNNNFFGISVDINYDGTIITSADPWVNKLYVFEKGNGWGNNQTNLSATLTLSGSTSSTSGWAVGGAHKISDDGNTIVTIPHLANTGNNDAYKKVYIYEKPVNGWSTTSSADYILSAPFGGNTLSNIDMSSDGKIIVVGDTSRPINSTFNDYEYAETNRTGQIFLFEKGAGWTTGTSNFVTYIFPPDAQGVCIKGQIKISATGNTILCTSQNDLNDNNYDKLYVFRKSPNENWQHGYNNLVASMSTPQSRPLGRWGEWDNDGDYGFTFQNNIAISGTGSFIASSLEGASGTDSYYIFKGTDPDA